MLLYPPKLPEDDSWRHLVFGDFLITRVMLRDIKKLRQASNDSISQWEKRVGRLLIDDRAYDAVPRNLRARCGGLVRWLYYAGLQAWVDCMLAYDVVELHSPADLHEWCRLQFDVLDRYSAAYFLWKKLFTSIYFGGKCYEGTSLTVLMVKALAVVDGIWGADRGRQTRAFELLGQMPIMTEYGAENAERSPSQAQCESLIHAAWKYMRQLGDSWPVEPGEVKDARAARRHLDKVVNWCIKQAKKADVLARQALAPAGDPAEKKLPDDSASKSQKRVNTESEHPEKKPARNRIMRAWHRACKIAFKAQKKKPKAQALKSYVKEWISEHEDEYLDEKPNGLSFTSMYATIRIDLQNEGPKRQRK